MSVASPSSTFLSILCSDPREEIRKLFAVFEHYGLTQQPAEVSLLKHYSLSIFIYILAYLSQEMDACRFFLDMSELSSGFITKSPEGQSLDS